MYRQLSVLFLALFMAASNPAAPAPAAPVVRTASGQLAGLVDGAVERYLGVPYAAAPIGPLRWKAPQGIAAWPGTRPAQAFGSSCMQPYPAGSFGPYTTEFVDTPQVSEDCLFLNVWRPAGSGRRMPVLVWIHGGAFLGGSGAVPIYDGSSLARRGIVVVTINYRVGPFGFLAHPALSAEDPRHASGNYGLLDQIAALQWIQKNIAAFGGDPRNVTIAGQSAGAASVNDLLVSPLARGLFHRASSESGAGMGVGTPTLAQAEQDGIAFTKWLGVADIAALRALPADKVQSAVSMPLAPAAAGKGPPAIRFQPVRDGRVLPGDPDQRGTPVVSRVPVISGFTADESLDTAAVSRAEFERNVRARYGGSADRLLTLYPHASDAEANASARLLARDRYMAALLLWSHGRVGPQAAPVFLYRFDHAVPVAQPPSYGAFHTAEVPYLFGALDVRLRPYTDGDRSLSDQMQRYWVNFMRQGDPNGPGLVAWPRATADGTQVMSLNVAPASAAAVSSPERLAALRDYVAQGGTLSLF